MVTASTPATDVFKAIENAKSFSDLIENEKGKDPAKAFKALAKLTHPDKFTKKAEKAAATKAMAKLTELYTAFITIGKPSDPSPIVIAGRAVIDVFSKGDICDLYRVTKLESEKEPALLKIVRSPSDNDLLSQEIKVLKKFYSGEKGGSTVLAGYMPQVYASFKASGRQAVILSQEEGFLTLEEVIRLFPAKLDFRHCVWIMNRRINALSLAHSYNFIHGAITPSHILLGPVDGRILSHDLRLVDWCYSVPFGEKVKALSSKYKAFYPPEILRKKPVGPNTDIFMAAKCIQSATICIPEDFRNLLDWCMAASQSSRVPSLDLLRERWTFLAKKHYGDSKYVECRIPFN
jgi:serine/threonine protein kinase